MTTFIKGKSVLESTLEIALGTETRMVIQAGSDNSDSFDNRRSPSVPVTNPNHLNRLRE